MKNHGPIGVLVLAMMLTGTLVNRNQTESSLPTPRLSWCNKTAPSPVPEIKQPIDMPKGLEESVIVMSVVLPMMPIIFNGLASDNLRVIKAHFAGQTCSFGLSQVLRHFAVYPEPQFLKTCNISSQDCFSKAAQGSMGNVTQLCNRSFNTPATVQELFDSLHHVPNTPCALLGASLMTMCAILFYWHRLNSKGTSLIETPPWVQIPFICIQIMLLITLAIYSYCMYVMVDTVQLYGILFGASIQFFIIVSMMRRM